MDDVRMLPENRKAMRFKLDYLKKHHRLTGLSESDLDWLIRMDEAFTNYGSLSPKQMRVVDTIFSKAQ